MTTIATSSPFNTGDEHRLATFGLSTAVFHDGLRRGASSASNRSSLALGSSAGTDVYHDGMEDLHKLLKPSGWRLLLIEGQPRLFHPEGSLSFAVSSGVNVGRANMRAPRTRKKGPATRNTLLTSELPPGLFDNLDRGVAPELNRAAATAPFYLLLWERVTMGGDGLALEFSQPAGMTDGGSVNDWRERIGVAFLAIGGDPETFDDRGDGEDEIDVLVEPRS